jgi:transcriptional regulator with GAF, ATPase, and Fis domain
MTPPPISIKDVRNSVQLLWAQGLKTQAAEIEQKARAAGHDIGSCYTEEILDKFITVDPEMLCLKDDVRSIQGIDDPVLICGETGTGKELIAQALHGFRKGNFVAINCPALSVDLMESELFGHVKGSFTGAIEDKAGKFQYAFNGTLFSDEIGDMPASMQAAILRVLQEKKITRVGDNKEIAVNPRIVCATHYDLSDLAKEGKFRTDLYWRLATFVLRTKPLRERMDDIKLMIKLWDKSKKFVLPEGKNLGGNVRELMTYIKRWNVLGR